MFELTPFKRHVPAYDPFRALDEMEQSMFGRVQSFRTDIKDTGDSFVIEAELPGFTKEDIDVSINGQTLTVTATHNTHKEEKNEKTGYIHRERSYGSYQRCFDLDGVDVEKITGALDSGILTLTLPKTAKEEPKARKIELA